MDASIILAPFGAMIRTLLVSIVGILAAWYPEGDVLLSKTSLQVISRISNMIFTPFLIVFVLGSGLQQDTFVEGSILIFFGITCNMVSLLFGWLTRGLHPDPKMGKVIEIAIANPNALSLPIVVMQSLCNNERVNAMYGGDRLDCTNGSLALLFIYSISFHLTFWTWGFPTLQDITLHPERYESRPSAAADSATDRESEEVGTGSTSSLTEADGASMRPALKRQKSITQQVSHFIVDRGPEGLCSVLLRCFWNRMMIALYIGVAVGVTPPIQDLLFASDGHLEMVGLALDTLSSPAVALNVLIMAASLTLAPIDTTAIRRACSTACSFFACLYTKRRDEEGRGSRPLPDPRRTPSEGWMYSMADMSYGPKNWVSSDDLTALELRAGERFPEGTVRRRGASADSCGSCGSCGSSGISSSAGRSANCTESATQYGRLDSSQCVGDAQEEEFGNDSMGCTREREGEGSSEGLAQVGAVEVANATGTNGKDDVQALPPMRSILLHCFGRLIFAPIVMYLLLMLFLNVGILDKKRPVDQLIYVIVLLEAGSPSAQLMIVSLNQLRNSELASQLAYMYVYMYLIAIFSVTFWVTVALETVYT